ncbi:kinase-like domain-containing protein [Aspergillus lucknowensis]|uniref:non-specific serine/threonine protein kinase n=1 Tax=Aspergillus lucknowensis TaxID=176173 RepID=A0ABR4LS87_9EURO
MSSPFLDLQGNTNPQERIVRNGSDVDVNANAQSLRREQDVYRRLQNPKDDRSHGAVRCLELSTDATQLAYMVNGDLRAYLAKTRPSPGQQLRWFKQMALTLSYIHDRRVLVADIASPNFLFDSDLSVKICDFTEASLLPLDSDMATVDDNGYTTQIDVGFLAAVMYEVITGTKCEIDLFKDKAPTDGRAYWPERRHLPSTQDIWLGWITDGSWTGEISSADDLVHALDSIDPNVLPPDAASLTFRCLAAARDRPHATIAGVVGLLALTFVIGRKAILGLR